MDDATATTDEVKEDNIQGGGSSSWYAEPMPTNCFFAKSPSEHPTTGS